MSKAALYKERGAQYVCVRERSRENIIPNEIRTPRRRRDSFFRSFLVTFQKCINTEWIDTKRRRIHTFKSSA